MKNFGMMRRFYDLCFMEADGGAGGSGGSAGSEGGTNNNSGGSDGGSNGGEQGDGKGDNHKTFSQEELNRIATKEKNEGKKAALKELGYEDANSAKKDIDEFKKWKESQKTEAEKAAEDKKQAQDTATAEKARADALEQKLDAIAAGVDPKYVDDVSLLARAKMSDTVDFKAALEEVKKSYPSFFGETEDGSGSGTGGAGNPARGKSGGGSLDGIGKRLAESKQPAAGTKPFSYFNN